MPDPRVIIIDDPVTTPMTDAQRAEAQRLLERLKDRISVWSWSSPYQATDFLARLRQSGARKKGEDHVAV